MKTVQQLIDDLLLVEDKNQEVMIYGHSALFPIESTDEDCEGFYINIQK